MAGFAGSCNVRTVGTTQTDCSSGALRWVTWPLGKPCLHCPLADRSPFLLCCSEAALVPFASQAALADPGPLYACLAVNAWLVLALSVALPLALLRLLERRSAAGHPAQQPPAERAAEQLKEQAAGSWPVRAFLRSSLLWSAVALVLRAWQAAAPGSLLAEHGLSS